MRECSDLLLSGLFTNGHSPFGRIQAFVSVNVVYMFYVCLLLSMQRERE